MGRENGSGETSRPGYGYALYESRMRSRRLRRLRDVDALRRVELRPPQGASPTTKNSPFRVGPGAAPALRTSLCRQAVPKAPPRAVFYRKPPSRW